MNYLAYIQMNLLLHLQLLRHFPQILQWYTPFVAVPFLVPLPPGGCYHIGGGSRIECGTGGLIQTF